MRFILNEQFILEETKYMLEERYSLTEADERDKMSKKLLELKTFIAKNIATIIDVIYSNANTQDAGVIKDKANLQKRLEALAQQNGEIDKLVKSIDELNVHNIQIEKANKAKKNGEPKEPTIDLTKLTSQLSDLSDNFNILTKSVAAKISDDVKNGVETIETQIKTIASTVTDINNENTLNKSARANGKFKEEIDKVKAITDPKQAAAFDWDNLYKLAATKEEKQMVTDLYIDKCWTATEKVIIKKIAPTFIKDCIANSFSTKLNALIPFVKKLIDSGINLTEQKYIAIHNAIADSSHGSKITSKDLLGKGTLGYNNLLFCPALYVISETDMPKYLHEQQRIISNENIVEADRVNAVIGIFNAELDVQVVDGKLTNVPTGDNNTIDQIKSLRGLTRIKEILEEFIGEDTTKKPMTTEEAEEVSSELAATPEQAKQLITYLISVYNTEFASYIQKFNDKKYDIYSVYNNTIKNFNMDSLNALIKKTATINSSVMQSNILGAMLTNLCKVAGLASKEAKATETDGTK